MPMNAVADVGREPDAQDFEAIFRQLSPMVYRTARALTGRPEEAEDIVQAIFLKLIERELPVVFRKDPRAYLYRAAVNMSLDVLRSRRRFTFTHDVDALESPSAIDPVFGGNHHRRLRAALAQLSPEAVQIVVLRYVHGYTDADIARLLGTSRGAVGLRFFRVRARLKKLVRGLSGEKS
jgi:RNA polymerase sigma-70 factor (ECF subfamily)